ncbi:MAG: PPE family protein, partial [Mycobacteriaceae bacterium]|nr:PPE family protein [Mycobacteriaceae bacterium]
MTEPVWMASPPEVHSALLTSGPGPGPLLAVAAVWTALSIEYAKTAEEIAALLGTVQGGFWAGPVVEMYMAAHFVYLAWLMRASANSAAMAAELETMAAAHLTALKAMPTLPELTANHTEHAALVVTNLFGVNTIPIAFLEADYVWMWIQAATVMSTYQSVATAAVAAAPRTTEAPQIVKADVAAATSEEPSPAPPGRQDRIQRWLQRIGYSDFYNNVLRPLLAPLTNLPFFQEMFSGFDPWLLELGNPLAFLSPFNIAFALGYPMDIGSYIAFLSQTFAFIASDLMAAFASGN